MNNKKSLIVPRVDNLDTLSVSDTALRMLSLGAKADIDSVNWPGDFPSAPLSSAILAHSGTTLHILFSITATETRATVTRPLGPVADDTCFEIFLKHPGSPRYWNYEFNILGTPNVSSRIERKNPVRFSTDALNAIRTASSCTTIRETSYRLTTEWLLVSIPLIQFGISPINAPVLLEANLYSCASAIDSPYYLSWSPIDTPRPDFHRPEFFGYLILQ